MKCIICDMDGVLCESRQPASEEMKELIDDLTERYIFVIISGSNYDLIEKNVLGGLENAEKIYCLSCNGTQLHIDGVRMHYSVIEDDKKDAAIRIVSEAIKEEGIIPYNYDVIEDRGSQITVSLMGRTAPLDMKKRFDPGMDIRNALKKRIVLKIGKYGLQASIGGTTSIDITRKGDDKGTHLKRFLESYIIGKNECIYLGDMLKKGGNDYPVKKVIKRCIEVKDPEEAYELLKGFRK